jgi:hypothetical protein
LASAYEIQHYLAIARPKLIVVDAQFRARVEEALEASRGFHLKPQVVDLGGESPESVCVDLGV